jgi:hypothetical protein
MKKDRVSRDDAGQMVDCFEVDGDRLRRWCILAGVNDMMGIEVLTNAMGSPAKWSKMVASNAIGIRAVKLLDLGIVEWIRESFHSRSIEDDGVPLLTQNGNAEAFLGSFAARPS